MYCVNCGEKNENQVPFCTNCGTSMDENNSTTYSGNFSKKLITNVDFKTELTNFFNMVKTGILYPFSTEKTSNIVNTKLAVIYITILALLNSLLFSFTFLEDIYINKFKILSFISLMLISVYLAIASIFYLILNKIANENISLGSLFNISMIALTNNTLFTLINFLMLKLEDPIILLPLSLILGLTINIGIFFVNFSNLSQKKTLIAYILPVVYFASFYFIGKFFAIEFITNLITEFF